MKYTALLSTAACSQGVWMLPNNEMPVAHYRPVDDLMVQSDPICSSAGCTQYKLPDVKKKDYPKDYPVPNLGKDHDIIGTFGSLKDAERIRNHKWNWVLRKEGDPPLNPAERTLYNFKPALSDDIITSQNNLENAERDLGQVFGESWAPSAVANTTTPAVPVAPAAPVVG